MLSVKSAISTVSLWLLIVGKKKRDEVSKKVESGMECYRKIREDLTTMEKHMALIKFSSISVWEYSQSTQLPR